MCATSEQRAEHFLNVTERLNFATVVRCVFFEVGTQLLNVILVHFVL
jgi:hypothetical protein